jgi:SAM-dependent methyltransferase
VPPNCQFQVDDAESDWTFTKDSFDYIHCRDMYGAIRDFKKLVKQCYDHLKPGGYLELSAVHPGPVADDGTLPPNAAVLELAENFKEIARRMKVDPDMAVQYKSLLEGAGFEDITEKTFKIPSSPWPKDLTMKKIGAFELMNIVEGAAGFLQRGWTKDFGQTREELEMLVMRLRKELSTNKIHCYCPL